MKKENYCGMHRQWLAASLFFAGLASTSGVYSSDVEYKPAWLAEGVCGYETVTIKVDGKSQTVNCADLDIYTGRGFYNEEHCYRVEKQHHSSKSYYDGNGGYYQHCELKTHYYQLPVIKVEKREYDAYHQLISTEHSDSFAFRLYANGGYNSEFHLKSKQKRRVIAPKDHYTLEEHVYGYKTSIECNGETTDGMSVSINIDQPGKLVSCIVNNYRHKLYHPPSKERHGECVVSGYSLDNTKYNYSEHCHQPRHDCDPMDGKWYCSSHQIGKYAPASTRNVYKPKPMVKPASCQATGHNLDHAKYEYARQCRQPRVDCDQLHGRWYCSSEKIGRYAPVLERNGAPTPNGVAPPPPSPDVEAPPPPVDVETPPPTPPPSAVIEALVQ